VELLRQLKEPSLEGVRAFVCLLDDCLRDLSANRSEPGDLAWRRSAALQASFPALLWFRQGDLNAAAAWIERLWSDDTALGAQAAAAGEPALEFLAVYNLAVSELLATRLQDAQARMTLRRLMACLGLSLDHAGRMFGVHGDTVRLWERGLGEVPGDRMDELRLADKALDRLLALFRPERLPQVIRRKADLFERERALDWILRGRIADVADRYQAALAYQE
jgi:hypothetical protein